MLDWYEEADLESELEEKAERREDIHRKRILILRSLLKRDYSPEITQDLMAEVYLLNEDFEALSQDIEELRTWLQFDNQDFCPDPEWEEY